MSDTYAEYLQLMARYNQWMNQKLYAVCEAVPDEDRRRDLGAFFKSIHGTLNHLLLADRVWLGRFRAQPFVVESLSQELYHDFGELKKERELTDDDISDFVEKLEPERSTQPLTFFSGTFKRELSLPYFVVLTHLFNHQTHHRGQLTALLSRLGYDFGVTDLIFMAGQHSP